LTNTGEASQGRVEMLKERVKTVGISVIDRMPGPFQLEIEWIRALNLEKNDPKLSATEDRRQLGNGEER